VTHNALVYPLGHAVKFESDDPRAIEAVYESWGAWPQLFDSPALYFRFEHSDCPAAAAEPSFNDDGGTMRLYCDEHNQGSFRLATLTGWMRVSRATLGERNWFRYHLLESLVLTALDAAFFTPVHAACVTRGQRGVLLCGDSGAGKTTLAFAAARAGWTLVSEDGVHLAADSLMTAVGGAHTFRLREAVLALFPELGSRRAAMTGNGKMAITAEALALGMNTAWSTAVAHSVFLSRRPGSACLTALPVDQALPYCLEWVRSPDRSSAEIRLRELLARGCWRLEYDEFFDVLPWLEQLR